MDCCICLSTITDKQIKYTLSCNHHLHFSCYKKLIFQTKGNIFISCPMCREMNYNNEKPFKDAYSNIKILFQDNLHKCRCKHLLKNGLRCKKSASILNYGYCGQHPKSQMILPKEKYDLMCDYIYYLLLVNNEWRTKINMLDMTKKLLCKYPDKIYKLDDIHYYFNRFFQNNVHNKMNEYYINPTSFYNYYKLDTPPKEWIDDCIQYKVLI